MSNQYGIYAFSLGEEHIPIHKREYEELVRNTMTLEILVNEIINNPASRREDLLRIAGYSVEEKGEIDSNVMAGVFL